MSVSVRVVQGAQVTLLASDRNHSRYDRCLSPPRITSVSESVWGVHAGGTPKTTGIWFDDSYDRSLSPPLDASALAQAHDGNKTCSVQGTEVKGLAPGRQAQTQRSIKQPIHQCHKLGHCSRVQWSVHDVAEQRRRQDTSASSAQCHNMANVLRCYQCILLPAGFITCEFKCVNPIEL